MSITKKQKIEEVKNLTEKIQNFKSIILTDFTGLSVEKLRKLRQELKRERVYYKVIKKTLFKILMKGFGIIKSDSDSLFSKDFKGSLAAAVSHDDNPKISKILYNFSKDNEALKIVSGIIDGKILHLEEIINLAKLPAKEELIAKFMFILKFPLSKLAMVLKEVEKRKVV